MKFTLSWLKKYLDTNASCNVISDKLTSIGFEVESLLYDSQKEYFVVVDVIDAVQHPNADRLKVCTVSDGSSNFSIVCGAVNVRHGIKAVLAKVGAHIQSTGFVIKAAKIRGVESCGMLCSAEELGLDASNDKEILEVSGRNTGELFFHDDPVFDISVLPNRGDCLGVYPIARELAVAKIGLLKTIDIKLPEPSVQFPFNVSVRDGRTSILFRMISGIDNNVQTPEWLVKYLEAAGTKSVSAVVDIANYVMLTLSSPIHIYDSDKINSNEINIDFAGSSASFCSLDGSIHNLHESDLTVQDADGNILCLAGIVGGLSSSCSKDTKNVVVECGAFDRGSIVKTVRSSGISTAASYRFERYVDRCGLNAALDLVTSMILEICGGEISGATHAGQSTCKATNDCIEVSINKCMEFCSLHFSIEDFTHILESLGCKLEFINQDLVRVYVPSWRADLQNFMDITEEIIRFIGYDNVEEKPFPVVASGLSYSLSFEEKTRAALASRGMDEVITWSFTDSSLASNFGKLSQNLYLLNPVSAKLDVMRNSLAPNMITLLSESSARGKKNISIFEVGKIYLYSSKYDEYPVVAGLRSGKTVPKNLYKTERDFDFFDIKADVFSILAEMGIPDTSLKLNRSECEQYSKWESAECFYNGKLVAHFGRIHPKFLDDIDAKVFYFEVFIQDMSGIAKSKMRYDVSKYQSIERDFSFFIPKDIAIGDLLLDVRSVASSLVKHVSISDIYSDEKLRSEGIISVLISVLIGSNEKTLTNDEIVSISEQIIECISKKHGGKIRSV